MTNKDIEKTVSSAFSKAVPDVLASVLEQCDEQKGSVLMNNNAEMTEKTNKKRSVLRAVLIAAVLTVAMAVTVTAVSMTGLIDEREAFLRAYEHLVETSEEGEDIANLVIAGEENRLGSTVYEADLGLKSGRIVYKIDFQFIETIYHYTIDAKTAVVLDYSSEPAPVSLLELEPEPEKPAGVLTEDDIKAIVKEDSGIDVFFVQYTEPDDRGNPFFTSLYQVYAYSRVDDDFPDYHYYIDAYSGEIIRRNIIPESGFNPDDPDNFDYTNVIQQSRVRYTVEDHFGLTYLDSGIHYDDGYVFYMGYLEDGTYEVFEAAGGYVYHAFVDPDTFEIISEEITEHPHYDGEMVKAEPREDYIGMIEAENIAAKYFGIDPDTYKGYKPGHSNYCAAEPENDRVECYSVCFMDEDDPNGHQLYASIDCRTGEVINTNVVNRSILDEFEVYTPSTEAAEGKISEAVAFTVVLEKLNVELNDISGVNVIYDGSEYAISFTVDGLAADFKVDAVSGELISAEGPAVDAVATAE